MPVEDFSGNTFVAFMDISGFKEMMKKEEYAIRALGNLNQTGYDVLRSNNKVNGFFVSDSGILFVRDDNTITSKLIALLEVIKKMNKKLLRHNIMLTTSISYGKFDYHQRIEFPGIEKNPIYGNAYVSAFLDNELGVPKIQPGQCRIIIKNLENQNDFNYDTVNSHFGSRLKRKNKYYYFYWMVNNHLNIDNFEKEYNDTYKLKYQGMLSVLKKNHHN